MNANNEIIVNKNEELSEKFKSDLANCECYYQQLEDKIKEFLILNGYEYLENVNHSIDLEKNLRTQIEKLNEKRIPNFKFSDLEWELFYQNFFEYRFNLNSSDRSEIFIDEKINYLLTRNGETRNIYLIDRICFQNNQLQFISKEEFGTIILINGIPSIHLIINNEWGTTLEHIFEPRNLNQYTNINFSELFKFVQIYIISTGEKTKYFSNTTKNFKYTSNWSYFNNEHINNIFEFIYTFLNHETILKIITKYCVLDSSKKLIILRPYQIAAIEKIIEQINDKNWESQKGGCIWHTTGSGKTLTSFKTALEAIEIPEVDKVIFAVDRNDLYTQTLKRYKNFSGNDENDLISETETTKDLSKKLLDNRERIIITTVQKLHKLDENSKFSDKRIVIIMDECHRSQTKKLHSYLKNLFCKAKIFGFTGTPRFENSEEISERYKAIHTVDIFGKILHDYKMTEAMDDGNILKFKISGVPIKNTENKEERIREITEWILKEYDNIVKKEKKLETEKFNSILATESINDAISYYKEFERQLKEKNYPLKIAIIYSENSNIKTLEDDNEDLLDEKLQENQEKFLHEAIEKYEKTFNCKIYGSNDYKKNVYEKTSDGEIDILIVVNMFLTGFDAPNLSTLWVDKKLSDMGLIQAFSRTNRVSKSNFKKNGNIVCFLDIERNYNEAFLKYTGSKDIDKYQLIPYEIKLEEYKQLEQEIIDNFHPDNWVEVDPDQLTEKDIERHKEFCQKISEWSEKLQHLKWEEDFKKEDINLSDEEMLNLKEKWQRFRQIYKALNTKSNSNENRPVLGFDTYINEEINIDYLINLVIKGSTDEESLFKYVKITPALSHQEKIIKDFLEERKTGYKNDYKKFKFDFQNKIIKEIIDEYEDIYNKESTYELIEKWIQDQKINNEDLEEIFESPIEFRDINNWKNREEKMKEFKTKIMKILN